MIKPDQLYLDLNSPTAQKLMSLCKLRYDAVTKHLDLSLLSECEACRSITVDFNSAFFVGLLLSAIRIHAKQAISLDIGDNNIITLAHFRQLHGVLPNLQSLSLVDNALSLFIAVIC